MTVAFPVTITTPLPEWLSETEDIDLIVDSICELLRLAGSTVIGEPELIDAIDTLDGRSLYWLVYVTPGGP